MHGSAPRRLRSSSARRPRAQLIRPLSVPDLRAATLDVLTNPATCVTHRANLTADQRQAILDQLIAQGLVKPADGASITGGLLAGVFPTLVNDGSACPQLPQPFYSAPGSGTGGHHSYPGGLPVHEANNDRSDQSFQVQYEANYLTSGERKAAVVSQSLITECDEDCARVPAAIDPDVIIAAPMWHDWAKSMVFQWNADGTEFAELNFGGSGINDNNGGPGDSRTGDHHIMSIAEAMSRGLSPLMVITQASAHSAPTLGNEYKVVNWLRAAAILAQIDPVAKGYLTLDSQNHYRLPPLRGLGTGLDLNAHGQTNLRVEYALHNLSDADFIFSIPAVSSAQVLLATLATEFGYNPADTPNYNNKYRNVVLANLSAVRLLMIYGDQGLDAVRVELKRLQAKGTI